MLLSGCKINKTYKILTITINERIKRRLCMLGFTNGTDVKILNKSLNGSIILEIRGTRFAISKKISQGIKVWG